MCIELFQFYWILFDGIMLSFLILQLTYSFDKTLENKVKL